MRVQTHMHVHTRVQRHVLLQGVRPGSLGALRVQQLILPAQHQQKCSCMVYGARSLEWDGISLILSQGTTEILHCLVNQATKSPLFGSAEQKNSRQFKEIS